MPRVAWSYDHPQRVPAPPRHQVGLQVGGTGILQIGYRYRFAHPAWLDTGAFASGGGMNMSAGVVIHAYESDGFILYAGLGGGGMFVAGSAPKAGCDAHQSDCPYVEGSASRAFFYDRLGVAAKLGERGQHRIALDFGIWLGSYWEATDRAVTRDEYFRWPMAGLSYFYALAP